MKAQELKDLTDEELIEKESSLMKDLFNLQFQRRAGRVDKPHMFKQIKKDIARIKTVLRRRELGRNKG